MPSIIGNVSSAIYDVLEDKDKRSAKVKKSIEIRSKEESKPQKRRTRSQTAVEVSISGPLKQSSPVKWKSPRRCINGSPNGGENEIHNRSDTQHAKSPRKRLFCSFPPRSKWNPKDSEQMSAVKEVLHVSTPPSSIVCRDEEQERVLEFCKACIEQERPGSLYICGCPGTGKTLSMEKMIQFLLGWVKEEGLQLPNVLALNCTSLSKTSEIFSKILEMYQLRTKVNGSSSALQHLHKLFSQKAKSSEKMILIIADELDYLITKDRSVLHNLFMLTTFPFSRCILIGIANAIDLADRFLPKLQALNCKPMVVTFRAYSKDQILRILQQRVVGLPYDVIHPQALEFCARKVAAASGDMRKALCVCRSAIEILEAELKESSSKMNLLQAVNSSPDPSIALAIECSPEQEPNIVRVDHMAIALSRTFTLAIVDTIRFLPQHQQIILCSAVKLFRTGNKDSTVGELNKSYSDICKSALIPPAGILEFSNMCRVLSDQKVAAASGDMRKALCVCRSAIEILEAELKESSSKMNLLQAVNSSPDPSIGSF